MAELWRIIRVLPHTTKHPEVTRWEVQAARLNDPFRVRFLATIKGWQAALCDRAREKHLTVAMQVEPTQYGLEIQSVELAGEHVTPAVVVKRNGVIGNAEMFERR